jgi:GH25 family lysozyme M1 (1,4-beta-N-acetylmuramidase)
MKIFSDLWHRVKKFIGGGYGVLGVDVSFNQGIVDWVKAKAAGVVHAGIRWGQRHGRFGWTDSFQDMNWREAKEAGIDRYGYWVWDEREGDGAAEHMAGIVRVSLTYDGELPFVIDIELEPLDWDELRAFLLMVEDWAGHKPILYSGSWFYERVKPIPEWLEEYEHWLTGYNNSGPSVWGPLAELDITVVNWQQSSTWAVAWCESGKIDRDYWILDYEGHLLGGTMGDKVVKSDDLRAWIDTNEYEEQEPGQPPQPPQPDEFRLVWPTPDPKIITQWYGINPQWYAPFGLPGHEGLDLRSLNGTPIYAMAKGEVIRVESNPNSGPYGIHVRLKHVVNGEEYRTVYAHFQSPTVSVGDVVEAGEQVGLSDNTGNSSGPHLHFTVKHVGKGSPWMNTGNIVNPVPYMRDLFPECTIPNYDGLGWLVDVGGNFRQQPFVADNLIRYIPQGAVVFPTGEVDWDNGGDWWQVKFNSVVGWFWNPGYKLRAK